MTFSALNKNGIFWPILCTFLEEQSIARVTHRQTSYLQLTAPQGGRAAAALVPRGLRMQR